MKILAGVVEHVRAIAGRMARSSTTEAMCGRHLETMRPTGRGGRIAASSASSLGRSLPKVAMKAKRFPFSDELRGSACRPACSFGLQVEQLQLAGTAGHEQEDDAFGMRREMALSRAIGLVNWTRSRQPALAEEAGQGDLPQAHGTLLEEVTPGFKERQLAG